jgi:hypothetical protein
MTLAKAARFAMDTLEDAIRVLDRECGDSDMQQRAWEDLKEGLEQQEQMMKRVLDALQESMHKLNKDSMEWAMCFDSANEVRKTLGKEALVEA